MNLHPHIRRLILEDTRTEEDTARQVKVPVSSPNHWVIGNFFGAYSSQTNQTEIYLCDRYDPAVDFFMTNVHDPDDRRDVSVRAIDRTFHRAEDRGDHFFIPQWGTRVEKIPFQN